MGPKTIASLNAAGIESWFDCLNRHEAIPFNGRRRRLFLEEVQKSILALEQENIAFFTEVFPPSEQWRVLAQFLHRAAFVDIETTGLSYQYAHISVIAACRGNSLHTFVYGENLDEFLSFADECDLIVTFNGSSFDLPFMERSFCIPDLGVPHLDLRWIAYHMGYRGGLKALERRMGIRRPARVMGIDGFEAVALFRRWQAGDAAARDLLVSYCAADTIAARLLAERILSAAHCDVALSEPEELFAMLP